MQLCQVPNTSSAALCGARCRVSVTNSRLPSLRRCNNVFQVKASLNNDEPTTSSVSADNFVAPVTLPSTPEPVAVAAQPMSVFGAVQEAINGRAAMLGFLVAMIVESTTHQSVISQLGGRYVDEEMVEAAIGNCDMAYAFTVILLTFATFAPMVYNNETLGSRSFGPFTPALETKVGRVAMLGFAGLVVVEILKGNAPVF